jgi:hypothetical protein
MAEHESCGCSRCGRRSACRHSHDQCRLAGAAAGDLRGSKPEPPQPCRLAAALNGAWRLPAAPAARIRLGVLGAAAAGAGLPWACELPQPSAGGGFGGDCGGYDHHLPAPAGAGAVPPAPLPCRARPRNPSGPAGATTHARGGAGRGAAGRKAGGSGAVWGLQCGGRRRVARWRCRCPLRPSLCADSSCPWLRFPVPVPHGTHSERCTDSHPADCRSPAVPTRLSCRCRSCVALTAAGATWPCACESHAATRCGPALLAPACGCQSAFLSLASFPRRQQPLPVPRCQSNPHTGGAAVRDIGWPRRQPVAACVGRHCACARCDGGRPLRGAGAILGSRHALRHRPSRGAADSPGEAAGRGSGACGAGWKHLTGACGARLAQWWRRPRLRPSLSWSLRRGALGAGRRKRRPPLQSQPAGDRQRQRHRNHSQRRPSCRRCLNWAVCITA